jgi:tetratricopeptide (TPR) repeat protein
LYARYYWYGCYPYYWYGYNPVPYQYGNDTYNYYTYNYYGSDSSGPVSGSDLGDIADYQAEQPEPATTADEYFDAGVKAFEAGDFKTAVAKFALARQLAPDDKVLIFAHSQAYFAVGDYNAAAQVLRAALAKVKPLTEGVFYPRGLYSSDDILFGQIDELSVKANQDQQDTDLQLLLGYQWLGIGELDKAAEPLENAGLDSLNGPPANALLELLEELQRARTTEAEAPQETD